MTRFTTKHVGDFGIFRASLAKLGPDGRPVNQFGKQGIRNLRGLYVAAPDGFTMKACSPASSIFDAQGRVVVLANCVAKKNGTRFGPLVGALLRYRPDGRLDRSFAGDGFQALRARVSTLYSGIAEGGDGSLTVTGSDINTESTVLFRVAGSGEISKDFGPRGYQYFSERNEQFGPGISADDRGWTYGPITLFKSAKEEKDEKSWFGVVAIPRSGKWSDG
jgi:hypothetical protein